MARAATKRGKRPQADAQRARSSRRGGRQLSAAEQQLFFSRIRTHAKWAYILLAVVFAGGFAFLGVGSGNSDLTGLFNDIFHGGSNGPSISSEQKKVDKNPQDAKAWRDLATAYENKGRTEDAITALTTYTSLRSKDAKGYADLAALQLTEAQNLSQAASLEQYRQQEAYSSQQFGPVSSTPLGQALGQDPIQQAVQGQVSSSASDAASKANAAYSQVISTYQQLGKLRPNDATVQLSLAQTAESAGNVKVEIAALKRVAKLEPDQAHQIQAKIKQLQKSQSG
jgi:tetratricopeptide (TPR) repeat protein